MRWCEDQGIGYVLLCTPPRYQVRVEVLDFRLQFYIRLYGLPVAKSDSIFWTTGCSSILGLAMRAFMPAGPDGIRRPPPISGTAVPARVLPRRDAGGERETLPREPSDDPTGQRVNSELREHPSIGMPSPDAVPERTAATRVIHNRVEKHFSPTATSRGRTQERMANGRQQFLDTSNGNVTFQFTGAGQPSTQCNSATQHVKLRSRCYSY